MTNYANDHTHKYRLRVSAERFVGMRAMADGSLLRNGSFGGRTYIIVPIVSAVGDRVWWPANAATPELVPASVLAANAFSRNNRPVVMGHPKVSGTYVSANSPDILEKYCFGHMFNTVFEDGRTKVEAWLDVARAKEVGPAAERAIERFQAGEMVEVSEGNMVITTVEEGILGGVKYSARWVAAANDHLAILGENEIGACSNAMGCGGPRVATSRSLTVASTGDDTVQETDNAIVDLTAASGELHVAAMSQARTPAYTGTETSSWSKPSFADYVKYLDTSSPAPMNVNQCSTELKGKIAAHSLLGDPSASSLAGLAVFPVVNPANDKLNEKALRSVISGRNVPADVDAKALASAQEIARRLLNSEFSANISANERNKMKQSLFMRMAAKIRAAMSNNSLRWKLTEAISAIEPGVQFVDDEDVAKGFFRYAVMIRFGYSWDDDAEKQYHVYQRSFTIDADDNVTIGDDRVEVVYDESKAWVVLPAVTSGDATTTETETPEMVAAAAATSCNCHKNNQSEGETTMSVTASTATTVATARQKELAGKLIASSKAPFEESDRAVLEAMPETKLASLVSLAEPAPATATPATPETPAVTAAAASSASPASPPAVTIPADEYVAIKAAADAHTAQLVAHKTALVNSLKTAQSAFTEPDLAAMDLPMLMKMAAAFKVDQPATVDYSLRGVPASALGVSEADRVKSHAPTDTWGNARKLRAANAGAKQDEAN